MKKKASLTSRALVLLLVLVHLVLASNAFSLAPVSTRRAVSAVSTSSSASLSTRLFLSDDDQAERLQQLGYTTEEIQRSIASQKQPEPEQKVAVTEIEVDAFTLTAVGFALIAINFLVFANMGDGGIAGVVATIINTWGN